MVFARTRRTALWISLDMKRSQWQALRKTKRAALRYPLELPLMRGYQRVNVASPHWQLLIYTLYMHHLQNIQDFFCHYCLKKIVAPR